MKQITKKYLENNYNNDEYVWYACYGSNINFERFMYYITGDENEHYSTGEGCKNKSKPIDMKKFIFKCPIYFAGVSKRWNGGMAFLDYKSVGKSYGKIYKLKMSQFKGVLEQEQRCKLYDAIIYVEDIEGLPVFTFTSKNKLSCLNNPSDIYCDVIKKGLLETYENLTEENIESYLKNSIKK